MQLPLPLGEGWGEGLSAGLILPVVVLAKHNAYSTREFALSFAPSPPAPLPMGEGSSEFAIRTPCTAALASRAALPPSRATAPLFYCSLPTDS
jgi:hypothetical protein